MTQAESIVIAIRRVRAMFPGSGALEVGTPYHMLVMVILSARTRDEQVLKLAPAFFAKFPTVNALALASIDDVTQKLNSIGMYRQKARYVLAMAKKVVAEHGGKVPSTMDELTALPGVGRKTASVVLVAVFNEPAIAVDVHVQRIVSRLGWATTTDPQKTEHVLLTKIPKSLWSDVNHSFVPFGRAVCAPAPRCWNCPLVDECAFSQKMLDRPANADVILAAARAQQDNIERLKHELAQTL